MDVFSQVTVRLFAFSPLHPVAMCSTVCFTALPFYMSSAYFSHEIDCRENSDHPLKVRTVGPHY